MSGQATYRIEEEDMVAARRAHSRRRVRIGIAIVVVLVLGELYFILPESELWPPDAFAVFMVVALATLLIVALAAPYINSRFSRRLYRQSGAIREELTARWDDDGIHFNSDRGAGSFRWSDFYAVARGEDGIRLYQNQLLFYMLPKRILPQTEADFIVSRCEASGVKLRR